LEDVENHEEIAKIFKVIHEKGLLFSMDCGLGVRLERCRVLSVSEHNAYVFSLKPNTFKKHVGFDSIVSLELESNNDVIDIDGNDRWSFV